MKFKTAEKIWKILHTKKAGGEFHLRPFYGDDGHPRAWLIWDSIKICFRTVRDGHRKILWGDHSQR